MIQKLDELLQQFREKAVRDLVPVIETSLPYQANGELALKFYDFMLDTVNVVEDPNDQVMLIEDMLTTFDHDLSDYLMLQKYQVMCTVIENEQDTILQVEITCDEVPVLDCKMSLSTMVLMAHKRKLEMS